MRELGGINLGQILHGVLPELDGKTFTDIHGFYLEFNGSLLTVGSSVYEKRIPLFRIELDSTIEQV